jgi:hypothetical protein
MMAASRALRIARIDMHTASKNAVRVLHQVPAISNLICIGYRSSHSLTVAATTVT